MKKIGIIASIFCKAHTKSDSSYGFITLLKLEAELLSQISVDSLLPKITGILSKEIHLKYRYKYFTNIILRPFKYDKYFSNHPQLVKGKKGKVYGLIYP